MKSILFAIMALASLALLSVSVQAQVPTLHCVKSGGGMWQSVSARFKLKTNSPKYANSGDGSVRSFADFEYLDNSYRCYDARDLLDGRQNVSFHIEVDNAYDCKTWHINSAGSNWQGGTQNYIVKARILQKCKTE